MKMLKFHHHIHTFSLLQNYITDCLKVVECSSELGSCLYKHCFTYLAWRKYSCASFSFYLLGVIINMLLKGSFLPLYKQKHILLFLSCICCLLVRAVLCNFAIYSRFLIILTSVSLWLWMLLSRILHGKLPLPVKHCYRCCVNQLSFKAWNKFRNCGTEPVFQWWVRYLW